MAPNLILPTLLSYLNLLPLIFVWVIGIILSIIFWRRHPIVSMLAVIAMATLLVERFVRIFLSYWLPFEINHYGLTGPQTTLIQKSVNIFESLVNAAAWSLLLIALFGWRKASTIDSNQT
jgi:hypothetical protein